jgi:mannan endo-1,4-beta-mannosidase
MAEKGAGITAVIIAIIMAISVAATFQVNPVPQPPSLSLAQIKPKLDDALNSDPFQELRKNTFSDLVFLQMLDYNTNVLVNKYEGYTTKVPSGWKLDNTDFQFVTSLYNDDFKLGIFKQEIDLSYDNPRTYISYSNYQICEEYGTITLISNENKIVGPYKAQTLCWKRDKITAIAIDLNYYYESNVILDNNTVLTFLLKSNQDNIADYKEKADQVMADLTFISQTVTQTPPQVDKIVSDIKLKGRSMSVDIPADKCLFGVFHAPHQDYMREVTSLEEDIDFKFQIIMDYYSFNVPFSQARERILTLYNDKRIMLVTLQPFISQYVKDFDGSCLIPRIVNGEYDDFLFQWATGLKTLGEPVFLRFGNEMNGDWDDWCSWFYSLDPDLYIMAWIRIYTLFKEVGANNVYFVWNPHDRTYPNYNWNKEYLYYPGDSKVDWIGLTAYNNGVTRSNEFWREFDECYTQPYREYMSRYSSKPFMITEFACNEIGGNKTKWITQGFPLLQQKFENIRIAIWWDGVDDTWIYDIDSSQQSQEAFKEALVNPYFRFNAIN